MTRTINEISFQNSSVEALIVYIISMTNNNDVDQLDQLDRYNLMAYCSYIQWQIDNGEEVKSYGDYLQIEPSDPTSDWETPIADIY